MTIRKAKPEDAFGIAKVQVDSWRTTYKGIVPDSFLEELSYEKREKVWKEAIGSHHLFVAENKQGQIVGFVSGGKERSGKFGTFDGELYAIYLLKEVQGKRIGTRLVKALIQAMIDSDFRSMLVNVLAENPATHFYEALGGQWIGTDEVTIGGKQLKSRIYGWRSLKDVLEDLSSVKN